MSRWRHRATTLSFTMAHWKLLVTSWRLHSCLNIYANCFGKYNIKLVKMFTVLETFFPAITQYTLTTVRHWAISGERPKHMCDRTSAHIKSFHQVSRIPDGVFSTILGVWKFRSTPQLEPFNLSSSTCCNLKCQRGRGCTVLCMLRSPLGQHSQKQVQLVQCLSLFA